mgnify:CR=1 FL=1
MSLNVTPHLNFRGEARAALEHYQHAFGGDIVLSTHGEAGPVADPADADLVIWGQLTAPNGVRVMVFDVPSGRAFDRGQESFFVSVRGDDPAEVADAWSRLVEGGRVVVDLAPSPWSPLYGMVVDRFGVTWVLDVAVAYEG